MEQHVVNVEVSESGKVTVEPLELEVYKGDVVSWNESSGKKLQLEFEDESAFEPNVFALSAASGTGLIAKKVGRHKYNVKALEGESSARLKTDPPGPIIIIMDPSVSHA